MATLSEVTPTLANEIQKALPSDGKVALASQLVAAEILKCTYDNSCEAGYIYLKRPAYPVPAIHREAAEVRYTLAYADPYWFNIDIDHEGNAYGVEIIGRAEIAAELRHFGAL